MPWRSSETKQSISLKFNLSWLREYTADPQENSGFLRLKSFDGPGSGRVFFQKNASCSAEIDEEADEMKRKYELRRQKKFNTLFNFLR